MARKKDKEQEQLRSSALQTASTILHARRRAEEELLSAKEALEKKTLELANSIATVRATLDSATDALLVMDAEARLKDYNEPFLKLWGFTRDLMRPGRRETLLERAAAQLKNGEEFLARTQEIYATAPPASKDLLYFNDGRVYERYSKIQKVGDQVLGRVWSYHNITDRIRAEEALRDEATILELLNKTGTSIAAQRDLQSIVQIVTDAATELTGAKFGSFFYNIVDEHGEALLLYTLSGAPREAFEKLGHPRATAVFGPTFRGEGVIRSDDIVKDPRYGQFGPHHGMPTGHLPVRSYLAVPVVSRSGEVIGGLFFGHPEVGVFTERSERLAVGVAAQAAIAIDNARLYQAAQNELKQRRETEAALRQSEEFNRTIIDSSRDCIKTVSLDGVLLWVSEKGQQALCIEDLQMVVGKSWIDFWQGEDRSAAAIAVQIAREGGTGHFVGYFPVRDEARWWDVIVSPILGSDGKPGTLLAISREVTAAKQSEAERERLLSSEKEARERAQRETRMKDEFLATVSHELRTPLNAILGWANVLRATADPQEISEGLEVIERNARAQTQIIEDLLDMSRIISGNVRLDIQHVDIVPVIKAALESVRPMALGREIRVTSALDPFTGPVSGDPARLQQVLWNLLTNALKFTPKGGRVHVVLERVNSHIEISVNDTGQGIRPDFLPQVFDRFRQADSSTTRHYRGLGLGLAIVKNIVELHGGSVRAKSAGENQGSTFTIALPGLPALRHDSERRHPRAGSESEILEDKVDLAGVRVLAVDDEADARQLIQRILSHRGATVDLAAGGDDALQQLAKQKTDVLVMDIGMPDEDGYSVIRRVRQLGAACGGNVPALALTAFARSDDRRRAMLAGFQMHMSKPVEPSELVAVVASLASRTHSQ
jgi:PAS domain S-box-containing protein